MPDSDRQRVLNDVEAAFKDALRQAGAEATLRQGLGERIEARDVALDLVTGTAANFLIDKAKDALCREGYAASVTCQRSRDQHVDFIFDVNEHRVVIGVQIQITF
jgi:hypothetical protein